MTLRDSLSFAVIIDCFFPSLEIVIKRDKLIDALIFDITNRLDYTTIFIPNYFDIIACLKIMHLIGWTL